MRRSEVADRPLNQEIRKWMLQPGTSEFQNALPENHMAINAGFYANPQGNNPYEVWCVLNYRVSRGAGHNFGGS